MMSTAKIIVIGSLNADMVVKTPRRPAAGETITDAQFIIVGGGKGANQALSAARLGGNVIMIGHVGADDFGSMLINNLSRDGVDISNVRTVKDATTGVAFIIVDAKGENSIVVAPGANRVWAEEDYRQIEKVLEIAPPGSIILLQLEIPLDVVEYAMKKAADCGHRVALDPAPSRPLSDEVFRYVEITTPNEHEASQITGVEVKDVDSARRAGELLVQKGARYALVKLGASGCVIVASDSSEHIPAFAVDAVDTTAAGDAFAGGLAVALTEGKSVRDAVIFASAAGALSATRLGAQSSLPARTEVDEFLSSR